MIFKFIRVFILLLLFSTCTKAFDTTWWKYNNILYEIYIWSFKDSNGDGVGDIRGITQKLDHFRNLNIKTIYLTPFYTSPMTDMGYDITNYTDVDSQFGTLDDFDELIGETKKRGLKVMIDLVINHSSNEHPWFQKSIDRIKPYTNFYVWSDAKGFDKDGKPIPPNNWMSIFGGNAWTWNEKREQFYYHIFNSKQPDLNLRNQILRKKLKNILKFWLDRGVSGFRMDAVPHFIEDKLLRDEPLIHSDKPANNYFDLQHIYTSNLWETYEFLHELRIFMDDYSKQKNDFERILAVESYSNLNYTFAYYGTNDYPIVQFPFNFGLVQVPKYLNAKKFHEHLFYWLKYMPEGHVANWMSQNHDNKRMRNDFCDEYQEIMIFTLLTVPGIACIYYGQEIGMTDYHVRSDQRRDLNVNKWYPQGRDGERLPMQWDDSLNAGFTSNSKSWLPVNPNYWRINVEKQKSETYSLYNTFKILSNLRKKQVFKYGSIEGYPISTWVYSFIRLYKNEKFITILNLGSDTEILDLHGAIPNLPSTLFVATASLNSGYKVGDKVKSNPQIPKTFVIRPFSAILLANKSGKSRRF